MKTVR